MFLLFEWIQLSLLYGWIKFDDKLNLGCVVPFLRYSTKLFTQVYYVIVSNNTWRREILLCELTIRNCNKKLYFIFIIFLLWKLVLKDRDTAIQIIKIIWHCPCLIFNSTLNKSLETNLLMNFYYIRFTKLYIPVHCSSRIRACLF